MFKELIFPGYVRLSRAGRHASRKTSERGRLIQLGMLITMVVGMDMERTLAYQLFALLLCIIIGSRISLKIHPPNLSVQRHLPGFATANEPFEYYITVHNEGSNVERDLQLVDNPEVISPTLEQFRRAREPGEDTRNAYDRWIGFHRFIWLQRRNTGVIIKPSDVPDISLKASVNVTVEALPLRRGVVHLVSTSILHPDPFRFNYGVTRFDNHQQLLVLPKRYRISAGFNMAGGRHFQPGGINPTWSIGESDEFASLRDYRDGDSMRKIHWASSAKRNKPVVKEFQDEYFVRQALVLDTHINDDTLLEETIAVAASFAMQSKSSDFLLDLVYAQHQVQLITAGRGYAHMNQQLEALATVNRSQSRFEVLSQAVLQHARVISGCIIVLGDWDETRRSLIDQLRAMNLPVEAFVISHDESLESELGGKAHLLPVDHIQDRLLSL
ncbi:MAG: DUF58 domain-containing protein [Pseudomonadales bacterium]